MFTGAVQASELKALRAGEGAAYSGFLVEARMEECSKEFCAGPALELTGQLTASPEWL